MRTSSSEIDRAYFEFYTNPDSLLKVKAEPTEELLNRVSSGLVNNPIMVNNQIKIKEEPRDELIIEKQTKIPINERKRITAKNWYEKNKEKHKQNVKARDNDPSTTRKRYIRELNGGMIDIKRVKEDTTKKYDIKFENGLYV